MDDIRCSAHFLNTFDMMNAAIIEHEHIVFSRVWVHYLEKPLKPQQELVPVVTADLDVAIYNPVRCDCRK
jgi:hypothetical protein